MKNIKDKKDEINKLEDIYPQGMLTCSVCGKAFKANDTTRFIVAGGYTCTLKCFLDEVKRRDSLKIKENKKEDKDKDKENKKRKK